MAALAYADALPRELRSAYRASVAREWANLDPSGFLAYAESSRSLEEIEPGLLLLVATDPSRIFNLAGRLPNDTNEPLNALQIAALKASLELDSVSLLAEFMAMPPSETRDDFLEAAALHYARLDPDAAIAWMTSLASPEPAIRQNVIRGAVATDFNRAYALAEGADPMSMTPVALVRGALDMPSRVGDIASELAQRDDVLATGALSNILTLWINESPESVADWVLANERNISATLAGNVAGQLAQKNLDRALSDLDRIPSEWRDQWIPQIAGAYASRDARSAINWIAQFQGQASYEAAFNQVAMHASESDPRAAAEFVQIASPALQLFSANYIGTSYAHVDPSAATQWALGLESQSAVAEAAAGVAYGWAFDDVEAATRWARSLPRGEPRDAAITQLMRRSDVFDIDPADFLDAFSSAEARDTGVRSTMTMLSARDPNRARQLLEALVDDPELGAWARERLAATSR
jgi:hypothetical protein